MADIYRAAFYVINQEGDIGTFLTADTAEKCARNALQCDIDLLLSDEPTVVEYGKLSPIARANQSGEFEPVSGELSAYRDIARRIHELRNGYYAPAELFRLLDELEKAAGLR